PPGLTLWRPPSPPGGGRSPFACCVITAIRGLSTATPIVHMLIMNGSHRLLGRLIVALQEDHRPPLGAGDNGGDDAGTRRATGGDNGDQQVCRGAGAVGAQHVAVLPDAEAWLVGALADAVESPADGGRVLAVVGGRGGAGASVFATAVAVAVAESGRHAMLVDCDALSGGLDLAVGAEKVDGLRWSGLTLASGRVSASALHAALPSARLGRRS